MKINYTIATWSGERTKPASMTYYENVLKNHIKILNGFKNDISQVTIMKPYNNINNTYYDIELTDKIKIVDCINKYQSYGQWLKAGDLFLDWFDYFIFIEDDYVPATDNFDTKLISLYEEGTILCSKLNTGDLTNPYCHCAISNCVISSKTLKEILRTVDYDIWLTYYAQKYPQNVFFNTNYQVAFSRYFLENGILLKDYSEIYKVDYFYTNSNKFEDFSSPTVLNNEKIFTPIQNMYKQ